MKPSRTILMSMLVVGVVAASRSWVRGETPDPRLLWGIPMAAVIFAVVGEFAPKFGSALAMLMLVSAVFIGGPEVFDGLRKAVQEQKKGR